MLSRQSLSFWGVATLAALGEAAWFAFVNVGVFMDSLQYLRYADVLIGRANPYFLNATIGHVQDFDAIARRTAGYPLLLLLGGVPFRGSLIGILAIQAAMAVAMPLLVFKTLEPYSRRFALIGAIILIVSLEPFNYSKAILTEQSFKFLSLLLIYLAVSAFRAPRGAKFAAISVVGILLALVRPQGSLMAALVFGMLLLVHFRRWKQLIIWFSATALGIGLSSLGTAIYLVSYVPVEFPLDIQQKAGAISPGIQRLLLYNLYFSHHHGVNALSAEGGPERAVLRRLLEAYATLDQPTWTRLPPEHYFGGSSHDPIDFVDAIYRNPNPYYFNLILYAVSTLDVSGDAQIRTDATGIIPRVIWETYRTNPYYLLSFFSRYFLGSATSAGPQVAWDSLYITGAAPFLPENGPASREILDLVKIYIADFPNYTPSQWRKYPGGVDRLILDVFTRQPREANFWFLWAIADTLKGQLEASSIFAQSLSEFPNLLKVEDKLALQKLREFFFGKPTVYYTGKRSYDDATLFLGLDISSNYSQFFQDLPETMQQQIGSGVRLAKLPAVDGISRGGFIDLYTSAWLIIRNIINLIILLTLPFCFLRGAAWPATVIGLVILYNAAVIILLGENYIRYIDAIMPMSILLAALSMSCCFKSWRPVWRGKRH